ncbi:TPA: hypothetical protein PTW06_003672 [Clostridium botulinum]|nr:hypothetical protein [Clostridium botulinum]HDK7226239.1 hypothetical protein [Clostridium botulinum]HDK7273732.1 hypothetical protein [Clostridium botulinum]HDK7307080.1 hypothetical protein [Clostridium botulinum]
MRSIFAISLSTLALFLSQYNYKFQQVKNEKYALAYSVITTILWVSVVLLTFTIMAKFNSF